VKGVKPLGLLLYFGVILIPLLGGVLCFYSRKVSIRNSIAISAVCLMLVEVLALTIYVFKAGGVYRIGVDQTLFDLDWIVKFLNLILLIYLVYLGIRIRKLVISILSVFQIIPLIIFEIFITYNSPKLTFVIDRLSLAVMLLSSLAGSIIIMYSLGHLDHRINILDLKNRRQPGFFMTMLLLIAGTNLAASANNLMWIYFVWNASGLCIFTLFYISGKKKLFDNAVRALAISLMGGAVLIFGIIFIYKGSSTLSVVELANNQLHKYVPFALGLVLVCIAAFTRMAQFPFANWLTNLENAPLPLSAILHGYMPVSSGVYLIMRTVPALGNTMAGRLISVAGGFTFLISSIIALTKYKGRSILTYSTISNMGLCVWCLGTGSRTALGITVLLAVFHVFFQTIMHCCIDIIEKKVGSSSLGAIKGLEGRLPITSLIMLGTLLCMLLPSSSIIASNWIAAEITESVFLSPIFVAPGILFTFVLWARITAALLRSPLHIGEKEKLPIPVIVSVFTAFGLFILTNICFAPIYDNFAELQFNLYNPADKMAITAGFTGIHIFGDSNFVIGKFSWIPMYLIVFAVLLLVSYLLYKLSGRKNKGTYKEMYMCGEDYVNEGGENHENVEGQRKNSKMQGHDKNTGAGDTYTLYGVIEPVKLQTLANYVAAAVIFLIIGTSI